VKETYSALTCRGAQVGQTPKKKPEKLFLPQKGIPRIDLEVIIRLMKRSLENRKEPFLAKHARQAKVSQNDVQIRTRRGTNKSTCVGKLHAATILRQPLFLHLRGEFLSKPGLVRR
jgi:hypothetical protein